MPSCLMTSHLIMAVVINYIADYIIHRYRMSIRKDLFISAVNYIDIQNLL